MIWVHRMIMDQEKYNYENDKSLIRCNEDSKICVFMTDKPLWAAATS